MMGTLAAVVGVVQLARRVMALIAAVEKTSVPQPSKARHREP